MIYDKISNLKLYKGMNKNLDTAIDFITSHDLNKLPLGKTVVDQDMVFINVMETVADSIEERQYEFHKYYMDIQMDLVGTERIDTGDCNGAKYISYNEEGDVGNVITADLGGCLIGSENFIICMAGEPHKPNIAVSDDRFLKKVVCKVHI
ncbi:MAG: YhcH/YjgK/YiaL family protein [Lachnospiraceae bacterium]|nr:YhcH/YjgK/YiaL family protein [Lachnospiraceae bacterium]MDE6184713.1 YhcH/YjgK/YiaL family protein [Lachnospiraceae bacterium]